MLQAVGITKAAPLVWRRMEITSLTATYECFIDVRAGEITLTAKVDGKLTDDVEKWPLDGQEVLILDEDSHYTILEEKHGE